MAQDGRKLNAAAADEPRAQHAEAGAASGDASQPMVRSFICFAWCGCSSTNPPCMALVDGDGAGRPRSRRYRRDAAARGGGRCLRCGRVAADGAFVHMFCVFLLFFCMQCVLFTSTPDSFQLCAWLEDVQDVDFVAKAPAAAAAQAPLDSNDVVNAAIVGSVMALPSDKVCSRALNASCTHDEEAWRLGVHLNCMRFYMFIYIYRNYISSPRTYLRCLTHHACSCSNMARRRRCTCGAASKPQPGISTRFCATWR
jgi:hypothetical protein